MTAQNHSTSPNSATQPQPATKSHRATGKPCGRPRKHPEGYKKHLQQVKALERAKQAAIVAATPKLPTVRPLPPWCQSVQPYPVNEEVEKMVISGGFDLADLGTPCAHAKGVLSALLEHLTHKAAFEVTGLKWSHLAIFCAWSSDFELLYKQVLLKLDEKRVLVLKEAAYERAVKGNERGVYHDGRKIAVEYYPSDKMHELLLRGLDPATFGKVDGEGNQQAVQVNITL